MYRASGPECNRYHTDPWIRLAGVSATDELTRVRDTANVWVIRRGRDAICIDFGNGAVLDQLDELGVDRITDVLVTHYHRDGVQGLARAAAAGIRIWVPPVEQDLFTRAAEQWAARRVENDYDLLQERFSLLESVEIAGVVSEYRAREYGGVELFALPTPGHTLGSVSYIGDIAGRRTAFTGDLIYGPGQVWSLAATQWTYTGVEGQAAAILSLGVLARRELEVLLPAHGEPIEEPAGALAETGRRLGELMELRRVEEEPWNLERWLDDPWEVLSPHVLRNRTSIATSYALLSDTGAALLIDWGYDLWTGYPSGGARSTCRPRLESIEALRRNHGVERVETVVTTHYHDDHVAGLNLLREVYGTEVWSPENVSPILEDPALYDLPCLWFEPIPVDRVLPFVERVAWHEYELTVHPLPGHTRYAAAIEFEADGKRLLATGDQQSLEANGSSILNYQYRNRFSFDDFVQSAELYARLRPDLLLTGHWGAHELNDEQLRQLMEAGRRVAELHRELLPFGDAEGFPARFTPYRATVPAGATVELAVEVRNPFDRAETARVRLVLPDGWSSEPALHELELDPRGEARATFKVVPAGPPGRRPIAGDLTVGDVSFGPQAEALVTVT
jgi:glyoxylase-like metal-dependent hydrolase (beta-lactamase superfamily II)